MRKRIQWLALLALGAFASGNWGRSLCGQLAPGGPERVDADAPDEGRPPCHVERESPVLRVGQETVRDGHLPLIREDLDRRPINKHPQA